MSKVFYHSRNNEKIYMKLLYTFTFLFLIFGFYKNGISLYKEGYIGILDLFKPVFLYLISIVFSFAFSKLFKVYKNYRFLVNIIMALIVPQNINYFVYIGTLVVINLLFKLIKLNPIGMGMGMIGFYSFLRKQFYFLNVKELSVTSNYNFFDILIGKGVGGLSNTFLLLSIIVFFVLIMNINYKKQIPIYGFLTYYVLLILYSFISQNLDINLFLNNNFIFSLIFILPISIYSPYSKGASILFGIFIGVCSFGVSFVNLNFGIYLVIFVATLLKDVFDKFIVSKSNNNLIEVL